MIKEYKVFATAKYDWYGDDYSESIECDCWANDEEEAKRLVEEYNFPDHNGRDFVGVKVDKVKFISEVIDDDDPPEMTYWEYTV